MANIINFPRNRATNNLRYVMDRFETLNDANPVDTSVFSEGDDQAFLELIREWPCFTLLDKKLSLQALLEQYYDDELTLAQDCVLEFLFHMHDPDSTFDISNALYTWDEEDRNYFLLSISMHAELIAQIKHEEI